ncbi:MAG: ABC transporter ATP-binding protein [Rhizobiaceae bacterium]|nr:ABC transporter ATP-binding protein [Rhizobiaceae bacterium]
MLSLRGIEKSYGPIQVLHGIEADVEEGEIFAIIGPNGAGKTTLFKVMTGESYANAGTVTFDGRDVTNEPPHLRTRAGMGRTFQVARVFNPIGTADNVITAIESRKRAQGVRDAPWWAIRPSVTTSEEAMQLLDGVGLADKAAMVASELSHGDRKRLEIAMTLAGRPRILMMDEPTAGMSSADREQIGALIRRVMAAGAGDGRRMTVVMTEHDMSVIFGLASRILVMNQGRRIALGAVEEIRNDPQVRDVYLGKEDQRLEEPA